MVNPSLGVWFDDLAPNEQKHVLEIMRMTGMSKEKVMEKANKMCSQHFIINLLDLKILACQASMLETFAKAWVAAEK